MHSPLGISRMAPGVTLHNSRLNIEEESISRSQEEILAFSHLKNPSRQKYCIAYNLDVDTF